MVKRPIKEYYNNAIIPMDKDIVSLFYTCVVIAIICIDNAFWVVNLGRVLVDSRSTINLIPEYLVDKL